MKVANEFKDKTTAINQLWQTDFTYLKIIGSGWVYLSAILDDYSLYIVSEKLCSTMKSRDATDTIELALQGSGCDKPHNKQKPRLLSDNGASYVSSEFANYLDDKNIKHTRGAPYHPQTQGKIERWPDTEKQDVAKPLHLPGDLENQITDFVEQYNNHRYHESINNLTPADVYFGCGQEILNLRERIKPKQFKKEDCNIK